VLPIDSVARTAGTGAKETAEVLLAAGAAWNIRDEAGLAPGDVAFEAKHQEVFDLLVGRACVESITQRKEDIDDDGEASASGSDCNDADPAGEPPVKRRRCSVHQAYLRQRLRYEDGRLLDRDGRGIMMGWEAPLMERHAAALAPEPGADVLNVGFGLGLVDGCLQSRGPRTHAIIEAHSDVQAELRARGWHERPGVTVHLGKWQDVVGSLPDGSFDAIFWDTWKETYIDILGFFAHLPRLLKPGGRFSFFNGMSPKSIFQHAVFTRLAQEDLDAVGLTCDILPIELGTLEDSVWRGVAEKYWHFATYYMPLATLRPQENPQEPSDGGRLGVEASGAFASEPRRRRWPTPAVLVSDWVGDGPCAQ